MSGRALPPARLLAVVAPVSLVGVAAFVAATIVFARNPGSATTVAGVAALLIASTLAERFPVPVEGADANGVSLGFVFTVAALVLFGWAPATVVCVVAPTVVALIWSNSPWSDSYTSLRGTEIGPGALHLHLTLASWASDGLLAIFFFVAGLELKREFVAGDRRRGPPLPPPARSGAVIGEGSPLRDS